ncbi:MAG: LPP20 family lipoprotein [Treponema sp.]|nr:LPP20 family lipoprotein [Treponema sp.]
MFCFAKSTPIPEWISNHRTVYLESEYLAQRGSGETADKAKTDATSALARYFQMTVSANLSTTMQSITSGKNVSEQTTVIDDVKVTSEVDLFVLEYTEPYYFKKEKKWYCVAYIKRADAWTQYMPQIEIAKNKFLGYYENAQKESDPFIRLPLYKTAWKSGEELLGKLEYGRIISPKEEVKYKDERDKIAEIPVLFEASKKECTIFIKADGDYNRILTTAVSSALSKNGFIVTKTAVGAKYTAEIEIDDNAAGNEPIAITPSVNLKITGTSGTTSYSYETLSSEKTIAYTIENARKKAYPKLAKELEGAVQKDLGDTLKL